MLGATVMPHALFLGSFLATRNRLSDSSASLPTSANVSDPPAHNILRRLRTYFNSLFEVSRTERKADTMGYRDKYARENNDLSFIQAHLTHGLVDVIVSLLAIAVPINSAILIIAATVFHKKMQAAPAGLFDAYDLIKSRIGEAAGVLFAVALLCSGQTASITATLAGQVVSEGFIEWRISPFMRRIITRMLGLIPSMVVAIAVGRPGLNTLLVASQVVLSIVLPFVAFPLIYLTSSKSIMRVRKSVAHKSDSPVLPPCPVVTVVETPAHDQIGLAFDDLQTPVLECSTRVHLTDEKTGLGGIEEEKREVVMPDSPVIVEEESSPACEDVDEFIDYSNGWFTIVVVSLIFLVVIAANVYVIVILALGDE
ncbi:hypothetical protein EUX98_g8070 [Antrodiella citrinella]|uniref:Uncharacterized protein n=1 Tax=Antrodiella citrinella TaxID=2447956 RepID=A0A4S4MDX3_9APHY|nr:hypothetical protein EUX98_g8070 [Antrodiella citrinella]